MDDFLTQWIRFHPKDFPVSHTLRDTSPEGWIRFHSLPASKRYAEDVHEAGVIFERAETLGNEVLREGHEAFLVMACPQPFPEDMCEPWTGETVDLDIEDPEMARHFREMEARWHDLIDDIISRYCLELIWTFPYPDDECHYRIFAARTTWSGSKYADLLRQIADDEVDRVFWMSVATGAIFAPYDGGVDLILPQTSEVARLRARYADWLPGNESGL